MKYLSESLLRCLPPPIRRDLLQVNTNQLVEIRFRLRQQVEWVYQNCHQLGEHTITESDLTYVINAASQYSPWASETICRGYMTLEGGYRIGICGEMLTNGKGMREITSLCIRLSKDLHGIAEPFSHCSQSTLIIGPPGWGKTTFLRDLARQLAKNTITAVIDERGEVFPKGFIRGNRMDVLSHCTKKDGIAMVLRTMTPQIIAVDEITQEEDCLALLHAANCGIRLLATAHASSLEDLQTRPVYKALWENNIFPNILRLQQDKTVILEKGEL